ncbi:Regucalcin [Galemys pyrenaicus]|uniref:Regucalcin n=1 Tax=Galemys pyrenaicus TaxID=202257 RepID=A0A8J5ZX08_GALPY|nr:Regucalcin [Galemys pyrenaicus]
MPRGLAKVGQGRAMAPVKIEAVIRDTHRMAEGPVWEGQAAGLLYVDITAGKVCRWDPASGEVQTVRLGEWARGGMGAGKDRPGKQVRLRCAGGRPVGCVALHQPGSYAVAAGTCLGILSWGAQRVQWVAQVDTDKPHNRFNDGKVDPAGRFVAGTMPEEVAPGVWEPGQGSLYTLCANRAVSRQLCGLGIPNGLDWSRDGRTFYHVDSLARCVRAYDYHVATGELAAPRLVFQLPAEQGMPDGMCVDAEGKLWVACIDGGRVLRLDPETGTRLCTVEMPVSRVTSCCFGGPHYSDLYVTSASDGLSPEQRLREPQAGQVFKVRLRGPSAGRGRARGGGSWGPTGRGGCVPGVSQPSVPVKAGV